MYRKLPDVDKAILTLNNIEIIRPIKAGSFASFYIARNLKLGGYIGVKMVNTTHLASKEKENLIQEINVLRDCNHPNVVKVYGAIQTHSTICLLMEYCENGDLKTYLDTHEDMPILLKLSIL